MTTPVRALRSLLRRAYGAVAPAPRPASPPRDDGATASRVDLASFRQGPYEPGAPLAKQVAWFFCNAVVLQSRVIPSSGVRVALLRAFGASIGDGVVIKPGVSVKFPWRLSIGDNAWIGERVWIDNLAAVAIGRNACVSQEAYLLTGSHDYARSTFDLIHKSVTIEDGAWIGARAVVCPGVICGVDSVLAVGSIATKDLDASGIYQGNPAVWKRARTVTSIRNDAPKT